MSLPHRLQLFYRARLLGGAGRAAAAALLLVASLAAPGAAPILAAPAAVAPLAPQSGCGVVVNNSDNAPGSLRWTVGCAAAGTTVTFDASLAGQTIILTGTEIVINQPITIDGSAAPGIIVDAGYNSRIFNITAGGPVTLAALTLEHGCCDVGGAVFENVSQPLVLNSVRVLSSTVSGGTGGGLFADGPLTLTNSDFISDTSTSNGGGVVAVGAAVVTGGRFERDTCTTGGCSGGALYGFASLTISGTDFISNTSLSHGGAAFSTASAVLTNSSFQGNKCTGTSGYGCQGGGLYTPDSLTMTGTQFISNTSIYDGGGSWANDAALTGGSFQGNQCTSDGCQGGGLEVNAVLTVTSTDFISNTASGAGGGAIATDATLTGGRFERNTCLRNHICSGGGLYTGGTLTISGTQFISNTSTLYGGGAWANNALFTGGVFQGNRCTSANADLCLGGGVLVDTRLAATGTRFINNTSSGDGGGAWTWDVLLTGTTFAGNRCTDAGCQGGGLFAEDVALATGSAFTNNQSAGSGGAIDITETAQLTLTNVTLSGNMASVSGGGLYVGTYVGGISTANLYNVTVAGNQAASGGGLFVDTGTSANVTNTVIANNGAANCAGTIVAGTHNLEFPGNTCALAGPSAGFTTADPLLAPLALNPPGTTLTQALRPGSPARDHGDPVSCANSLVNNLDQRGAVRPDAVGEACDIGAYEAGPPDWLVFLPLVLK